MAAGAVVLLAIVTASLWSALRTGSDVEKAADSFFVRSLTRDILEAVTAAESGQRGYLLTGKDFYLTPYQSRVAALPAMIRQLSEATPDDPDLASWRTAIQSKLDELALTISLAQQGRRDEAMGIVQSDRGQQGMEQIRALAKRMTERQRVRLVADLAHSRDGVRAVIAVDVAAFAVLVLLIGVVVVGVPRACAPPRRR
jgi:CHASE3 domain sensor protein